MKRFLIICIVIVTIIITADVIMQKVLFKDFEYLIECFYRLDEESNQQERISQANHIGEYWKSRYLIMAFYIEHGELEKIRNQIVVIKAGLEKNDEALVHEEIKRSIYIIEHIEEKITLKFDNIL